MSTYQIPAKIIQLNSITLSDGTLTSLYASGDISLLSTPIVSIIGSRNCSENGKKRAKKLAKELTENSVTIMSGLAKGIDESAHQSAIQHNGKTIAVIGTSLYSVYPKEHQKLQEQIYKDHILISPFSEKEKLGQYAFPLRNKVMAQLSHITVIIEAEEKSGTIHQARECLKLRKPLFFARSLAERRISWIEEMLVNSRILDSSNQILNLLK